MEKAKQQLAEHRKDKEMFTQQLSDLTTKKQQVDQHQQMLIKLRVELELTKKRAEDEKMDLHLQLDKVSQDLKQAEEYRDHVVQQVKELKDVVQNASLSITK